MPPGWGFDGNTKVIDLKHKVAWPSRVCLAASLPGVFVPALSPSLWALLQPGQNKQGLSGENGLSRHKEEEEWEQLLPITQTRMVKHSWHNPAVYPNYLGNCLHFQLRRGFRKSWGFQRINKATLT